MKRVRFSVLILFLILLTGPAAQAAHISIVSFIVTIDNEDFRISGIAPRSGVFLDTKQLSMASGVKIKPGPGNTVYIGNKLIQQAAYFNGTMYISAEAFAGNAGFDYDRAGLIHVVFTGRQKERYTSAENLVDLKIISRRKVDTSNPNETMLELEVKFTNECNESIQFTNNHLFISDEKGRLHPVSRLRNFEIIILEPGESAQSDRVFFVVDTDSEPKRLLLRKERQTIGTTNL